MMQNLLFEISSHPNYEFLSQTNCGEKIKKEF